MTSTDIYDILSSKPHNPHYLNRYFRFINWCIKNNSTLPSDTYFEKHHFCPKANDLFPEYKNFKTHPWNAVHLTAMQHIIAHQILWKAYGGSQAQAYECMLGQFNASTNQYLSNRQVPPKLVRLHLSKTRQDAASYRSDVHRGMASYKDADGNIEYLAVNSPEIAERGLVGIWAGSVHSEATRHAMSKAKIPHRKVTMYKGRARKKVYVNRPEYKEHLDDGWTLTRDPEVVQAIKAERYEAVSQSLSGRVDYATPDGQFYGKLYPDDPQIKELGLVYHLTNNRVESAKLRQQKAVEANTGAVWYNNGTINKKFKSPPGEPWVEGVLYSDSTKTRENRAAGVRKVRQGKVCYNDGKSNFYFYPTDTIPEHLVKGMAPQKPRNTTNLSYVTYNDGKKSIRVYPGDTIDPSWTKGMLPRKPKQ